MEVTLQPSKDIFVCVRASVCARARAGGGVVIRSRVYMKIMAKKCYDKQK